MTTLPFVAAAHAIVRCHRLAAHLCLSTPPPQDFPSADLVSSLPWPRLPFPQSWLCASHLISVARLCVAQGALLDFVSIGSPHCLLVSSNNGVEDPLKRQSLDPLCSLVRNLLISTCTD